MIKFFSRYGHWLSFLIIAISFFTMFIDFKYEKLDIIAVILGGIGMLSIGLLAVVVENHIRKKG
jgi:hypothetical protein